MIEKEWEFKAISQDKLKYKLNIPKAKIISIMSHRGQIELRLLTKDGRLIYEAEREDSTDLAGMRRDTYAAYRRFASKTL